MNAKHANRLYLIILIVSIAINVLLSVFIAYSGVRFDFLSSNFIMEMAIVIPSVIYVIAMKDSLTDLIPFKKIHIGTFLLVPLFVLCSYPLVMVLNAFTMIFVDNAVTTSLGMVTDVPFIITLFSIGIFAPFCEEIVCRGILFHSYRRTGRIFESALMSAILFGLMHMNFNQAAYAFALGLLFAFLVEITGSVFTTFWAHCFFNSLEVCLMYAMQNLTNSFIGNSAFEQGMQSASQGGLIMLGTVFAIFPLALVTTIGAVAILYVISCIEGTSDKFKSLFKLTKFNGYHQENGVIIPEAVPEDKKIVTPEFIIAMIVAVGFMLISEIFF